MQATEKSLLSDFTAQERFLLKKALSRLSAHDDTPRRLCERLGRLEYQNEPVSQASCVKVVRFLHAQGLLSETRYADDLVHALQARGYGSRRILQELSRRKFSEKILLQKREELSSDEEWERQKLRAFEKLSVRAAARRSDLSDSAERARLYGYLARLGFSSEICRGALEQLTEKDESNE